MAYKSMIERVARAIYEKMDPLETYPWDEATRGLLRGIGPTPMIDEALK